LVTLPKLWIVAALHVSLAVGRSNVQALPHWAVLFAGHVVMLGAVVSFTVTVKLHWLWLAQASVAVQVTVVVPKPKVVPLAGLQVTVGLAAQVSVAVGVAKVATAPLGLVQETVVLAGQAPMAGAVVSITVTVWLQGVEWLPDASVASQVRVAEKVVPHSAFVTVPRLWTVAAPQVSLAVGASNVQGVPHSTLWLATQVSVGAVVSCTVTVKLQGVEWLPAASVAVQVTVVVPSGKLEPEFAEQLMLGFASTLSVAVTVKETVAAPPPVHSAVIFAGQVITGGVVSPTVTVNWHGVDRLPEPSLAVQLTVVVPELKLDPDAGVQVIVVVPASSVAVAVKVTTATLVVMLAGQVMTGGVVSGTVMVSGVPLSSVILGVLVLSKVTVNRPPEVVRSRLSVVSLPGLAPPLLRTGCQMAPL
jgi:hypothetical protein